MHPLIVMLLVLAGILLLLLVLALFTRKNYTIQRSVVIHAPQPAVFDYLKQLKNQDHFNKWVMVDPNMKRHFKGTDGTVGFVYAWDGNKRAGAGEQEIKAISSNNIETEIRFIRPFAGVAQANLMVEPEGNNQTKVTWSNASKMAYPMNLMIGSIETMLGKDMDTSLGTLKGILER